MIQVKILIEFQEIQLDLTKAFDRDTTHTHVVVRVAGAELGRVGDGLEGFEENGEAPLVARLAAVEQQDRRLVRVDCATVVLAPRHLQPELIHLASHATGNKMTVVHYFR